MVTTEPTRRERRKQETRARLLGAAIRLIEEQGFDQATVDSIAAAANIGKGTVYNYFRTKEDTVIAFFIDLERRVQTRMARWTSRQLALERVLVSFLRFQFGVSTPNVKG